MVMEEFYQEWSSSKTTKTSSKGFRDPLEIKDDNDEDSDETESCTSDETSDDEDISEVKTLVTLKHL
ncbi:hypothetical protein M8J76_010634 [Diaphorina citri]|nr:hypothetical protein M8J76_010634 [Diaphorina citri]